MKFHIWKEGETLEDLTNNEIVPLGDGDPRGVYKVVTGIYLGKKNEKYRFVSYFRCDGDLLYEYLLNGKGTLTRNSVGGELWFVFEGKNESKNYQKAYKKGTTHYERLEKMRMNACSLEEK